MTNEEILKKAIEKAIKGGYVFKVGDNEEPIVKIPDYGTIIVWGGLPSIIFSHEFAKAFWGKVVREGTCWTCGGETDMDSWRKHLQRMVLEKEPLKYLERFL